MSSINWKKERDVWRSLPETTLEEFKAKYHMTDKDVERFDFICTDTNIVRDIHGVKDNPENAKLNKLSLISSTILHDTGKKGLYLIV